MDPPEFPDSKSPRRELQGPRPAPLKVRKDSHKIKKPPVAPPHASQQQPPQYRPPVIIYTVSPKVIHTDPREFMTLVQRLTGLSSNSSSSSVPSSSSSSSSFPGNTGGVSPAARYASIVKTKSPEKKKPQSSDHMSMVEGIEISTDLERSSLFPGILSPGPAGLPPIPPSFFSPPSDPNPLSFFHDLSPVFQGNKNYIEGSFMPSPSNFLSPYMTSPNPSLDFFSNFFDV